MSAANAGRRIRRGPVGLWLVGASAGLLDVLRRDAPVRSLQKVVRNVHKRKSIIVMAGAPVQRSVRYVFDMRRALAGAHLADACDNAGLQQRCRRLDAVELVGFLEVAYALGGVLAHGLRQHAYSHAALEAGRRGVQPVEHFLLRLFVPQQL